jgi:phospho-N-acetylmuramoyl-pentapeptide-transferase
MGSVMLQVGYFKATKGKRIFRMTPLHHHFQKLGWPETQIVARFWIVGALSFAIGMVWLKWL